MGSRREIIAFCAVLAVCVAVFFHETLFGGKVLSPADVLLVSASFRGDGDRGLRAGQPALDGPGASVSAVARIQPDDDPKRPAAALERACRLRSTSSGQRPERGLRPVPSAGLPRDHAASVCLDRRGAAVDGRARHVSAGAVVGAGTVGAVVRRVGLSVLRLPRPLAAVSGNRRGDLDALAVPGDRPRVSSHRARAAGWLAVVVALSSSADTFRQALTCCSAGGLYALAKGFWERADGARRGDALDLLGAGDMPGPGPVGGSDPAAGVLSGEELGLERPPERAAARGG